MESWKKIIVFGLIAIMSINTAIVSFGAERNYGYEEPFEIPALTGDWRTDIIAVAKSQVGYKEAEDGSTYFGAWIGKGEATQGWCSEFASWCAYKAGIPETIFPHKRSSNAFQEFFHKKGQFFFLEGGIRPEESGYRKSNAKTISLKELKMGDILLVDTNSDYGDGADHTALVISYEDGLINAVSGNVNNAVWEKPYFPERIHGVCRPAYEKNQNHDSDSSTATKSDTSHSSNSSSGTGSGGGGSSGGKISSGLSKQIFGSWEKDAVGWWYKKSDGSWPVNSWYNLPYNGISNWYYFNEMGYMATGWITDNGQKYYLNPVSDGSQGKMLTGWQFIEGKWYYFHPVPDGMQGRLYINTITPDGYKVGMDGTWIP